MSAVGHSPGSNLVVSESRGRLHTRKKSKRQNGSPFTITEGRLGDEGVKHSPHPRSTEEMLPRHPKRDRRLRLIFRLLQQGLRSAERKGKNCFLAEMYIYVETWESWRVLGMIPMLASGLSGKAGLWKLEEVYGSEIVVRETACES